MMEWVTEAGRQRQMGQVLLENGSKNGSNESQVEDGSKNGSNESQVEDGSKNGSNESQVEDVGGEGVDANGAASRRRHFTADRGVSWPWDSPGVTACVLRPCEVLYVPGSWYHATLNLDAYNVFVSTFVREKSQ